MFQNCFGIILLTIFIHTAHADAECAQLFTFPQLDANTKFEPINSLQLLRRRARLITQILTLRYSPNWKRGDSEKMRQLIYQLGMQNSLSKFLEAFEDGLRSKPWGGEKVGLSAIVNRPLNTMAILASSFPDSYRKYSEEKEVAIKASHLEEMKPYLLRFHLQYSLFQRVLQRIDPTNYPGLKLRQPYSAQILAAWEKWDLLAQDLFMKDLILEEYEPFQQKLCEFYSACKARINFLTQIPSEDEDQPSEPPKKQIAKQVFKWLLGPGLGFLIGANGDQLITTLKDATHHIQNSSTAPIEGFKE